MELISAGGLVPPVFFVGMADPIEIQVARLNDQVRQLADEVERLRSAAASPFLTRDEAAAFLRCSTRTIDELAGRGAITRKRVGANTIISKASLLACLMT